MIVRVAIGPTALIDLGAGVPVRQAKVNHEQLLRAVRAHGTLVFDSNAEAKSFVDVASAGEGLPPGAGLKWRMLLAEFLKEPRRATVRKPPAPAPLGALQAVEELRRTWNTHADIVVLDEATGTQIGIPEDDGLLEVGGNGLEAATAVSAPYCRHLTKFRQLMDVGVLPQGASRDTFWESVLAPLARTSATVTIIDKFLFKGLWNGAARRHPEQVVWLMQHLDATLRQGGSVTMISQGSDVETAESTLDLILDGWNRSLDRRIGKVTVTLVPQPQTRYGRREPEIMPHDRHIRFGVGGAVVVPPGFDRLYGENVRDQDGMKWDYKWDPEAVGALRAAETRSQSASGAQSVTRMTL